MEEQKCKWQIQTYNKYDNTTNTRRYIIFIVTVGLLQALTKHCGVVVFINLYKNEANTIVDKFGLDGWSVNLYIQENLPDFV